MISNSAWNLKHTYLGVVGLVPVSKYSLLMNGALVFLEDSIIDPTPVKHFLIDSPKMSKVLPLLPTNNCFLNCNSIHKLGIYSLLLFSCFLIFPNIKYLTVYTIIVISIRPFILTYDFQTRVNISIPNSRCRGPFHVVFGFMHTFGQVML